MLEDAIDGIKRRIGTAPRPFLAYFHLLPPHEEYRPRREYIGIFDDGWVPAPKREGPFSTGIPQTELDHLRREYDEYLAFTDAEFGRLLDWLEQSGRLDDTIVVVTSDHGQLFERGIHGHITETLYEPVIRVPLLISTPGRRERVDVQTPTSCVDLLPTLLHLTGRDIPDWCEGQVLPVFGPQEPNGGERSVFAVEAKENPRRAPLNRAAIMLRRDRYKLVGYLGYGKEGRYELYDVMNDPEERENLFSARSSISINLRDELQKKLERVNQPYL